MRHREHPILKSFLLILGLIILAAGRPAYAQTETEPTLYEQAQSKFKQGYFNVSALIRANGTYLVNPSGEPINGFNMDKIRLGIKGKLDTGFSYKLQFDFAKSPALLDANIGWQQSDIFAFKVGLFKAPFGGEARMSSSKLDFIKSARVAALSPSRQVGFMTILGSGNIHFSAGMFNGNGGSIKKNENNRFMYVAGLDFDLKSDFQKTKASLSALYNDTDSENEFDPTFIRYGASVRTQVGKLLLNGEFGTHSLTDAENSRAAIGLQVTVGYNVLENHQLLIRWDAVGNEDEPAQNHMLIFGYNTWLGSGIKTQLNVSIPTGRHENASDIELPGEILIRGLIQFSI